MDGLYGQTIHRLDQFRIVQDRTSKKRQTRITRPSRTETGLATSPLAPKLLGYYRKSLQDSDICHSESQFIITPHIPNSYVEGLRTDMCYEVES